MSHVFDSPHISQEDNFVGSHTERVLLARGARIILPAELLTQSNNQHSLSDEPQRADEETISSDNIIDGTCTTDEFLLHQMTPF